ncbi:acetyl/propionyl/methylcrotonyl-CoA carboxylase subunit alpha [Glaciibacter psychrotolerans]
MFRTVLVANRGEIACRIMRTLHARGIRSVAVYSDADRDALHVSLADVAVRIGPAAAAESYLNAEAIVAAAVRMGAEAIHPGYGFLSENERFAEAVTAAGLVFIGPNVHALRVMGDKIRSKKHVAASGVPTIPGLTEPGLSNAQLSAGASQVGYPLMIKPSAGGGGKGMQVVEHPRDLAGAIETARRISARAFGDDTLFLERLIPEPRHIEVQVLADNFGHIIHLGERECSLQRRHQKVIEEAPSPLLDAATRARIGQAACDAARSVDYRGAGTVEFLVSDAAPDEFFFMEMNTRLQVEHPVTELVTGLDLVDWQLRIAAGEPLTLTPDQVVVTGHAIEARVYAENPAAGFLPATGTVRALTEPQGEGIRMDSSLREGLELGADYDPMLAKVIAHGPDRATALARLDRALAHTVLLGLPNNIEFLRMLLHDRDVVSGALDTGLIERLLPTLTFGTVDDHLAVAAALALRDRDDAAAARSSHPLWSAPSGWRLGPSQPTRYTLVDSAEGTVVVGNARGPRTSVWVDGPTDAASVALDGRPAVPASLISSPRPGRPHAHSVAVAGMTRTIDIVVQRGTVWLGEGGSARALRLLAGAAQLHGAPHLHDAPQTGSAVPPVASPELRSPMPGTVVVLGAATGDVVAVGDVIVTVEAMKMEHALTAAVAGTLTLATAVGDAVRQGQLVATIEAGESP